MGEVGPRFVLVAGEASGDALGAGDSVVEGDGQGLGRVLVRALIDAARQNYNASSITLNVYRDNLPAARLYRSLGFVVAAEDEGQNSYAMRLDGVETS